MRTTLHDRHRCAQNADHLAHNSPFSTFFAEVVCTLGTTPPRTTISLPPIGGIGIIRGVTRRRHADSQLLMLQNPHRRQRGGHREHGEPGPSAHEQQKPSNRTQGRPTSGTKLSPRTRPRRMCGTKLSLLTRNGPIWRTFCMQGEFCTALVSTTPSRESFVPNARQSWD